MRSGKLRVLIGMTDAGGGHRRLSEAIEAGLKATCGDEIRVSIADLFALDAKSASYQVSRLYGPMIRYTPALYGLLYHVSDNKAVVDGVFRRTQARLLPYVRELVAKFRPDLVLSTHPLCNRLLLDSLEQLGSQCPSAAVVSEIVTVHKSWVDRRIDAYSVATDEVRDALVARGADPTRISVLGLPVAQEFGRLRAPAAELLADMKLDPQLLTVLAVGGGEGAGDLAGLVKALDRSGLPLQTIVVCGRNRSLYRRLVRRRFSMPVRIFGYVADMPMLMHAAEVLLTKGGPQTIAEGLASGRPILVYKTLPGQERGNQRFVERHHVGWHVPTSAKLTLALTQLLEHPELRLEVARHNLCAWTRGSATRVAEWALALASGGVSAASAELAH